MAEVGLAIRFAGVPLQLLPQRAAFLPSTRTLLVADAHIGKAVSFRRLGVPVPSGHTAGDLARLDECVAATGATGIVFLGDLLHSARALAPGTLATVSAWRERQSALALWLVRGNHDARAGDPPPALRIHCVDEPFAHGGLLLCHHPQRIAGHGVLAGHVHPGLRVSGRARDSLRLPCFHFAGGLGVLPAFGGFTGLHVVTPEAADEIYLVAPDGVQRWPPRGARGRPQA